MARVTERRARVLRSFLRHVPFDKAPFDKGPFNKAPFDKLRMSGMAPPLFLYGHAALL